jgi:hypothetical protein
MDAVMVDDDNSVMLNLSKYTKNLHQSVINLWNNKIFKNYFILNKSSLHISDGVIYLIEKITCIQQIDLYVPDNIDIMHSRRKTIGITEFELKYGQSDLLLIDVGGQRNERKVLYT